jgi:hypothetical protein
LRLLALVASLLLCSVALPAQAPPNRPSDKDIDALIAQVDKARDKFEGSLDSDLKKSLLRSDKGEVSVSAYLQDLQDNIKKLKDRHVTGYSASAEVETVLKQCNVIDAYVQRTTTLTKGRSEWEQMAGGLKNLAAAYGATFPLPAGASVRRVSDKETTDALDAIAASAGQLKSAIGGDKSLLKTDQDAGKKMMDELAKSVKALRSRVADGKPASAESRAVFDQLAKVNTFTTGHPTLLSTPALADLKKAMTTVSQSFGAR